MTQHKSKILTFTLLVVYLTSISGTTRAADAPAGTLLAEKQELVRNNGSEPASLDPHKVESNVESNPISDMFDGLVAVKQNRSIEPRLAASRESKGNTVWTFYLRSGITWLDGSAITAQDVVWSWQRLVSPQTASPYASYLGSMHVANAVDIAQGNRDSTTLGVKALDDTTLETTLTQPTVAFLAVLAHPSLVPLDKVLIGHSGDKWTRPEHFVSSGMYKLSQWVVSERIAAGRNSHYWGNRYTVISKVTYLPISLESAGANRYKTGETDTVCNVPANQFMQLKETMGDELYVSPQLSTYYYQFNTTRAPLNDPYVRRVLNMVLDEDIIVQKIMGQGQRVAWVISQPEIGGVKLHAPEYASWPFEKCIAEARRLLAEAGFGPEHPLGLNLLYNTFETYQRIAIAASSIWKKNLGVGTKLQNQEWKTMSDTIRTGNFDAVCYVWIADHDDASSFLNTFRTGDSENTIKYSNPAFDEATHNAAKAASLEEWGKYYWQVEDLLGEGVPTTPVYHYVCTHLVKPWVGGFAPDNRGNYYTKDMYIKKH